jgi:hypothetical protein
MRCKECKKETVVEIKKVDISIRYPNKAIEIVADDICMECLLKALSNSEDSDREFHGMFPELAKNRGETKRGE